MKKLPLLTLLLWFLIIAGYVFLPRVILQEYVQYPLVVLLSIVLPVSLWIAVQEGRRVLAVVMAGIFLLNTGLLLFVLENNYSVGRLLEQEAGKGIRPEVAAFLADNPAKSQFAAHQIYQHHGVAVPYRSAGDTFELLVPSEEDKKLFRENFKKAVDKDVAAMNSNTQTLSTFMLLALHVGIFLLLLIFLLVYEQGLPTAATKPDQSE